MKSLSKILNYLIILAIIGLAATYYSSRESKKREFQDLTIKINEREKKVDQVVNKYIKLGNLQNELNKIKVENELVKTRKKLIEDHGIINSNLKDVDAISLLESALSTVVSQSNKKIKINRQFDKIPLVQFDEKKMNQVFVNILGYHFQAIATEGNVWLTAQLVKGTDYEGGKVKITLQDDGVGMSPDVVNKLFYPTFYSSELGISLVRMLRNAHTIITDHKGDMSIKSKKDKGTEITLLIPLTQGM